VVVFLNSSPIEKVHHFGVAGLTLFYFTYTTIYSFITQGAKAIPKPRPLAPSGTTKKCGTIFGAGC
jgi:hypothetical protein